MDAIKINRKNTLMIAHRGLSSCETENTNAAFIAAGNRSYYGIETDIHVTADGQFAVIHDSSTGRVSETNIPVEGSSLSDLQQLLLKDTDGTTKRCDLRIPTLSDYVRTCKKYEKTCVLELKNTFSEEDIEKAVSIIRSYNYLEHVIFISFHEENLITLRELLPDQPLQLLVGNLEEKALSLMAEYCLDLDIGYKALTREMIQELHAKGIRVNCWTCDNPEDAEQLIEWGVDYITSNCLE